MKKQLLNNFMIIFTVFMISSCAKSLDVVDKKEWIVEGMVVKKLDSTTISWCDTTGLPWSVDWSVKVANTDNSSINYKITTYKATCADSLMKKFLQLSRVTISVTAVINGDYTSASPEVSAKVIDVKK